MLGLWIFLAIVVGYVMIALLMMWRQRRHPTIDWSQEAGAPSGPHQPAVSQFGAAMAGSIGSPEDNIGLQPKTLKRKK
jgi:hypothetical protein